MKYIYIVDNTALEILPQYDNAFPDIPIEERYTSEFLGGCIKLEDEDEVEIGWIYNSGRFFPVKEKDTTN